jgi:hypothetical protein
LFSAPAATNHPFIYNNAVFEEIVPEDASSLIITGINGYDVLTGSALSMASQKASSPSPIGFSPSVPDVPLAVWLATNKGRPIRGGLHHQNSLCLLPR